MSDWICPTCNRFRHEHSFFFVNEEEVEFGKILIYQAYKCGIQEKRFIPQSTSPLKSLKEDEK